MAGLWRFCRPRSRPHNPAAPTCIHTPAPRAKHAPAELKTHVDDEYADVGLRDPKILITTSRDPSSRLQQFSKEMRLMFPGAQRMNRGGHVLSELVAACRANEATDLIVLHEHRGQPGGLSFFLFLPHLPFLMLPGKL